MGRLCLRKSDLEKLGLDKLVLRKSGIAKLGFNKLGLRKSGLAKLGSVRLPLPAATSSGRDQCHGEILLASGYRKRPIRVLTNGKLGWRGTGRGSKPLNPASCFPPGVRVSPV